MQVAFPKHGVTGVGGALDGGSVLPYDAGMATHEQVPVETLVADPRAILDLVEHDGAIVDVMRGKDAIAVISPAPVAAELADLRRALAETPADDSYYLDVMATRRMLGL